MRARTALTPCSRHSMGCRRLSTTSARILGTGRTSAGGTLTTACTRTATIERCLRCTYLYAHRAKHSTSNEGNRSHDTRADLAGTVDRDRAHRVARDRDGAV